MSEPTYHKAVRIPIDLYQEAEKFQNRFNLNFSELVRIALLLVANGGVKPEAMACFIAREKNRGGGTQQLIQEVKEATGEHLPQEWVAWVAKTSRSVTDLLPNATGHAPALHKH